MKIKAVPAETPAQTMRLMIGEVSMTLSREDAEELLGAVQDGLNALWLLDWRRPSLPERADSTDGPERA